MTFCVGSLNQKYTLAHQQMQQDYERLKQEENDKSNKLQELMYVCSLWQLVGMDYRTSGICICCCESLKWVVVGSHW